MNYDKSTPLITIEWPQKIQIRIGSKVKAIGNLTGSNFFRARTLVDEYENVFEESEASAKESEILNPLIGKVVSVLDSRHGIIIYIFPLPSKVFSFESIGRLQPLLLVPEFWSYLEERGEWEEKALLRGRPFDGREFQNEPLLTASDVSWIQKQGQLTGDFDPADICNLHYELNLKLQRVDRLAKKAFALDDLRRHLLACTPTQKRDWALQESAIEGAILIENASFAVYSVLDVFSHIVNRTFGLGLSDLTCGFTQLFGRLGEGEDEQHPSESLPQSEPLFQVLDDARTRWVNELREMRHFFAHRGSAPAAHTPRVEAAFFWQRDFCDDKTIRTGSVFECISAWREESRTTICSALVAMQNRAKVICEAISRPPQAPSVVSTKINTPAIKNADDFVNLLLSTQEECPERTMYLYGRLEKAWKIRWPYSKFCKYLHSISNFVPETGMSSSGIVGHDEMATRYLVASLLGRTVRVVIDVGKRKGSKPALLLTPLTQPQDFEQNVIVTSFKARQSQGDTGFCVALFSVSVRNIGTQVLESLACHAFFSDSCWASTETARLNPGQECSFDFETSAEAHKVKDPNGPYLLPLLILNVITVRVTYERQTELGDLWAEDFLASGTGNPPPQLKQIKTDYY